MCMGTADITARRPLPVFNSCLPAATSRREYSGCTGSRSLDDDLAELVPSLSLTVRASLSVQRAVALGKCRFTIAGRHNLKVRSYLTVH